MRKIYILISLFFVTQESFSQISESQVIANANTYLNHSWYASSNNIGQGNCSNGTSYNTPGWVTVGNHIGLPYCWGNNSSINAFDNGLLQGKPAGDNNTSSDADNCTLGVDCSGFVSRCYGLATHYNTVMLDENNLFGHYSSYNQLQVGDFVNKPGSHTRLVTQVNNNGSINVIESGQGNNQWRVFSASYTFSELINDGYNPQYYTNMTTGIPNLDCSNAVNLSCGVVYSGGSSSASSNVLNYGCNSWTESGPERVHTITPIASGTITATISNFTGDLDVYILGSCNPSDCLGTISSSSATYTNAQAGTTYYIVVDADDGSGSAYDLIVNCPASSSCNPPTNLNITNIEETTATFNWSLSNALGYEIELRTSGGSWTPVASTTQTTTSWNLSGLNSDIDYEVRIKGICSGGEESNWAYVSFTTAGNSNNPPSNDNCNDAVILSSNENCNYVSGSVDNATDDGVSVPSCDNLSNIPKGVWYRFTATSNSHNVEVSPNNSMNAVITLYSAVDCFNLSEIACEGAESGASGDIVEVLYNNFSAGELYWVRVYDYGNIDPTNGNFDICITNIGSICNPPTNLNITNIEETTATFNWSLSNALGYEIEYRIVGGSWIPAASTTETATSWNLSGLNSDTNYEVRIKGICSGGQESNWAYVSFTTNGNNANPPSNNNCNDAITLNSNIGCNYVSGSVDNATDDGVSVPTCDNLSNIPKGVWYRFTATSNSHNVEVSPNNSMNAVIALYSGSNCFNLSEIVCEGAEGGASGDITQLSYTNFSIGESYWIRIYDYGNIDPSNGDFNICVTHQNTTSNSPELRPTSMSVTPNNGLVPDDQIQVMLKVDNEGNEDAGSFDVLYFLDIDEDDEYDTNEFMLLTSFGSIDANDDRTETHTMNLPQSIPTDGSYYVYAFVDWNNDIAENDEGNNDKRRSVDITIPNVQLTYIPDDAFEQRLIDLGYDDVMDNYVETDNISGITFLFASDLGIADVTGIEDFTSIETLYFNDNNIQTIDLSQNLQLEFFQISGNNLTSIDVSNNILLESFNVSENNLTQLDISNNTNMYFLSCDDNQISQLDLTNNQTLGLLNAHYNNISHIDLSQNINLSYIWIRNNPIESLDFSNNPNLEELNARSCGSLVSLNLKNNSNGILGTVKTQNSPNLYCIQVDDEVSANNGSGVYSNWDVDSQVTYSNDCTQQPLTYVPDDAFEQELINQGYDDVLDDYVVTSSINSITSIQLSNLGISDATGIEDFISLESLILSNNNLSSIDLSSNVNLEFVSLSGNNLSELDVTNNLELEYLILNANNINEIDLSNNAGIRVFEAWNSNLNVLDVSNNPLLETLRVDDNNIQSIDLSQNPVLDWFECRNNQLTSLDVSQNPALELLYCEDNQIANLILNNPVLEILSCSSNQISALNVSQSPLLEGLYANQNNLSEIDMTLNMELSQLFISENNFTNINLTENQNLTSFIAVNNQLNELNLAQCTELVYLEVSENQLSSLDLSSNSSLEYIICSLNALESIDLRNGANTNIEYFQALDNQNLYCIEVDDIGYSSSQSCNSTNFQGWCVPSQSSYSEDCALFFDINYQVQATSLTCIDSQDGRIEISTENETFDYGVNITSAENNYDQSFSLANFNNRFLSVFNLNAGEYIIDITIDGISEGFYIKTYILNVLEVQPLEETWSGNPSGRMVSISSGTSPFTVTVNGQVVLVTNETTFVFQANHGDLVEIKTAIACEGKSQRVINDIDGITMYPNPTDGRLIFVTTQDFGNTQSSVLIQFFDINGRLVKSKSYEIQDSRIEVNIEDLSSGTYFAKLENISNRTFKIIKE